jgi:hypothetical protein
VISELVDYGDGSRLVRIHDKPTFDAFCHRARQLTWDRQDSLNVPAEREFLGYMGIYLLYAPEEIFALEVDGRLVSINVTHQSKRKRADAWGRYINFYCAYTMPGQRYKGYASRLVRWTEEQGRLTDHQRMRSLAMSYAGFRLHYSLGHHFYGLTEKGELVIDTPLADTPFPDGVPRRSRQFNTTGARLTDADLRVILSEGRFKVTEAELEKVLGAVHV